jgi:hypothetical protein
MRNLINIVESAALNELKAAFEKWSMEKCTIVHNRQLIHFTTKEGALAISREGFRFGSPITAPLHLTYGSDYNTAGINFGFDVADDYSIMTLSETTMSMMTEAAVVFQADGVEMYHYDGWNQVAFWGDGARGPFFVLDLVYDDDDLDEYDGDLEPHERVWKLVARNGTKIDGHTGTLFEVLGLLTTP